MAEDLLKELWETAEPTTAEDLRRWYGDCPACLDAGSTTPGVASERAVWVGPGGEVSEDIYHVCAECLGAANGGPGYYKA